MCEVESRDYVELRKEEKSERLGRTCMKCKEASAVLIIRVGDAFCKSCFKDYFVHKFRAILGKNRVVYPGEKVLLAYSGGPSSSAMIHQVQEGLGRDAPKKLRFLPSILFIDEGAVCGQSWEQREQNVSEIHRVLQKTNFPFHIVPLEQVFTLPRSILQSALPGNPEHALNYKQAVNSFLGQQRAHQEDELSAAAYELAQLCVTDYECGNTLSNGSKYSCPPPELTTALMEIFNSARTLTAKLELLQSLRSHLILHVVRTFGYSKVMSGESCTRLAVRLLANISLGRGAFLPLDTGFSDDRYGDVVIVRPMREYSLKEISFYNKLFHVESVFIPTMETKAPENSSIQHLSESFITKLQADFPSTVSTMYRTSEKLNISRTDRAEEDIQQEKCLLCMCNLDIHVGEASAFCATQVSQNLSQKMPKNNAEPTRDPEGQCCNGGQCSGRSTCSSSVPRTQDIFPLLCYSCRVTVKDMDVLFCLTTVLSADTSVHVSNCPQPEKFAMWICSGSGQFLTWTEVPEESNVDPVCVNSPFRTSVSTFPPYILQEAAHRSRRLEIRREIQEFLLDDGCGDTQQDLTHS